MVWRPETGSRRSFAACLLLEILSKGFSLIFRVSSRTPSSYFKVGYFRVGANTVQCSVYAKSPLNAHNDSQITSKNAVLIFLIIEVGMKHVEIGVGRYVLFMLSAAK
jgi:hypothetical protein